MKSFNVVTGLPRSGSTLLCNILNQNPEFYASSTSPIPQMCGMLSHYWSNSAEVNSMLINDKDETETRLGRTMQEMINAWYKKYPGTVFDKSRGWSNNALMLKQLFPKAVILCTVRDLRSVFGSIEKQHQKLPILDHAQEPMAKTLLNRADQMFGPDGMIGGPVYAIEDLVRRDPEGIYFVKYEEFAKDPEKKLAQIYEVMDLDPFDHDFENVENVAEDVDELYLGKFEHNGSGKVVPVDQDEWKDFVSPDIGALIMERYPYFNEIFGYTE